MEPTPGKARRAVSPAHPDLEVRGQGRETKLRSPASHMCVPPFRSLEGQGPGPSVTATHTQPLPQHAHPAFARTNVYSPEKRDFRQGAPPSSCPGAAAPQPASEPPARQTE